MSHGLARAVCIVYWFHPLVWIAWRRLALEAERACDDAVLGHSEATAYADQLVGLAERLSRKARIALPAMANRADLTARVRAVLDGEHRRGRAGAAIKLTPLQHRPGGSSNKQLAWVITEAIGNFLDRPLIDETGLQGPFDFQLIFTEKLDLDPDRPDHLQGGK